jgi:pSer/pThr/pTyr-binding forkhead associated (FHA) protein
MISPLQPWENAVSNPELMLLPTTDLAFGKEGASHCINRFPCVLGRSHLCDEQIDDLMVSRRHCLFSLRDGRVWVEDLESRNGTRLNGQRLTAARPIQEGDVLEVANLEFGVYFRKVETFLQAETPPPTTRAPGTARRSDMEAFAPEGGQLRTS